MLLANHLEERLLVINGRYDSLVRPNLPSTGCGGLAQSHAHRAAVLDQYLVNRTDRAHDGTVGHSATMNGMEVAMETAPGDTQLAGVGQNEQLDAEERRHSHSVPMTGSPRGPGREGHRHLERLTLEVLVHEIEHGPLTQLMRQDIRLVLLVDLHVGSVLVGYFDLRRMRRAPEGGPHQLLGERRLAHQAGHFAESHHVLLGYGRDPLGRGATRSQ